VICCSVKSLALSLRGMNLEMLRKLLKITQITYKAGWDGMVEDFDESFVDYNEDDVFVQDIA
jgi:hypothetical protein